MIADETDQEASLDSTLEVPQDLWDRTATMLQKLQSTGDGDECYLEVVHDLVTLCDATQLILYDGRPGTADLLCQARLGAMHREVG